MVKNEKDVRIQEYQNGADPKKMIWVAWSPTGEGLEKDMVLEGLPGKISRVELMPLEKMEPFAAKRVPFHETENDRAEMRISESPAYIFF